MNTGVFEPTEEQRSVITHDGSAFVSACPGAGKTEVLIERARVLYRDLPPGRGIAFLSFTNSAISELEARLRTGGLILGSSYPSYIGTFDSFLWQFLLTPFGVENCSQKPRLIPDLNSANVRPYSKSHPISLECFHAESDKLDARKAAEQGFKVSEKDPDLLKLYERQAKRLRLGFQERGFLHFDDARRHAFNRLRNLETARILGQALKARFKEIIVDEVQDCNRMDLRFVSWLRWSGINVKLMCDPDQSIYGFRGGVTDELNEYEGGFEPHDKKRLTGNFRSSMNICRASSLFRNPSGMTTADRAIGRNRREDIPVYVISYQGAVDGAIGKAYSDLLNVWGLQRSACPLLAATRDTGNAAVGLLSPNSSSARSVRLARAVSAFQHPNSFAELRDSLDLTNAIVLEIEGKLHDKTYDEFMAEEEIDPGVWRPRIISLLRSIEFRSEAHGDTRKWFESAKKRILHGLSVPEGSSPSRKLIWNSAIHNCFNVPAVSGTSRTIHSVKGMEFPGVCVVTTTILPRILKYLETGTPSAIAEQARKLYVACSRAKCLLAIAAPEKYADTLTERLRAKGAMVDKLVAARSA